MGVELSNILVEFPGARALDHVSAKFDFDEIHGIVGENGAGKSTFVNVLGGSLIPTAGQISVNGVNVTMISPRDALSLGISHVSQEGNLVPELSGAANIQLGEESRYLRTVLREREIMSRAQALMARWFPDVNIDLARPVSRLAVADQKIIEIVRALRSDINLIILDEPTATLQSREKAQLWHIIRSLPKRGVGVVLISHFLTEIIDLSDIITVLRDGQKIQTMKRAGASEERLVDLMLARNNNVGQIIKDDVGRSTGEPVLEVSDWRKGSVRVPKFQVRSREIIGLIGLTGAGHFEFARTLFDRSEDAGTLKLAGKPAAARSARAMQRGGVALIPDHRMINALIGDASIAENLSMVHPEYATWSKTGVLRNAKEGIEVKRIIDILSIKTNSSRELLHNLSGGNKQKVSIGKWLYGAEDKYRAMIFVEPTEGVDVGAKQEIYGQIRQLAAQGMAVIIASSDLVEIEQIADRVVPFVNGQPGSIIERADFSEAHFITSMTGQ